jgi:hypothetical protein
MYFDPTPINLAHAVLIWLAALGVCAAVGFLVAFVLSFAMSGAAGPAKLARAIPRGIADLVKMSPRRVGAIASLTAKESIRRQDILVGVVFVLLFMFAGWFLSSTDLDTPAKPYISFVLTAIRWLIIPVALLLSCWGLPADIKIRSLHTVVTKPVRRSEVVLGRMLGYGAVMTLGVVVMGLVGYVWILRSVPESARQTQLVSRVPVYGELSFINRTGEETNEGINVGDLWTYRSFVEGNTIARAVYEFDNVDRLSNDEGLTLEYRFEVFRSHKGDIDRMVLGQFELVNAEKDLVIPYPPVPFEVREFADIQTRSTREGGRNPLVQVPRTLTYTPSGQNESVTVDLFEDVVADDGSLIVKMRCADQGQYLGAARTDLFIRTPDRSFATGYFKAILGTWLMAMLVIILGTTASTFVKGPVATLLTFTLILTGLTMRPFMDELVVDYVSKGQVMGGGMLESAYRMVTQMNVQSALPDNVGTDIITFIDRRIFDTLVVLRNVIPDFTYFDMTPYVANGFDVPWDASLLPSILTTIGFLIPCIILGYFSLQVRELEAK